MGARRGRAWVRRWEASLGDVAPRRDHTIAVVLVGTVALVGTLVVPPWESELDELTDLRLYLVPLAVAWSRRAEHRSATPADP